MFCNFYYNCSLAGHYIPFSPNFNVYPTTKHAITSFTETLLNELANTNIKIKVTVSCVYMREELVGIIKITRIKKKQLDLITSMRLCCFVSKSFN